MRCMRQPAVLVMAACLLVVPALLRAEDAFRFTEKTHAGGALRYVNEVPVLRVQGSAEEIGPQTAGLIGPAATMIAEYPRKVLLRSNSEGIWQKLVEAGRALWPRIPPAHRVELDTAARVAGVDRDMLVAGNIIMDVYRGLGCSSLVVEPCRSKTGGPLFGRNLDFYGMGFLHEYTLVTVCRPEGKHAFASVGFAGLFGCISGMNDAGLALAVHEVLLSRDGSKLFDPTGVPYTFVFRRILEECATVEEAEALVRACKRTTMLSLAVCDREKAVVLEMTPQNVVVRPSRDGILACTNHFRTKELAFFPFCSRYTTLAKSRELGKLGVDDVASRMDAVNMRILTLQSMVFELETLKLHLAFGKIPASKGPFHTVDLKPLLAADGAKAPL